MYCKHCGLKIDDDSLFCSRCGSKIGATGGQMENTITSDNQSTSQFYEITQPTLRKMNLRNILVGSTFLTFSVWLATVGFYDDLPRTLQLIMLAVHGLSYYLLRDLIIKMGRDPIGFGILLFILPSVCLIILGLLGVKDFVNPQHFNKRHLTEILERIKDLGAKGEWMIIIRYCSQVIECHAASELYFHRASALMRVHQYALAASDLKLIEDDPAFGTRAVQQLDKIKPYI